MTGPVSVFERIALRSLRSADQRGGGDRRAALWDMQWSDWGHPERVVRPATDRAANEMMAQT